MKRWIIFAKERFPPTTYALLVGGICASGVALRYGSVEPRSFLVSFTGLMLFFAVLRLMDEYKDRHTDRVGHPERPLPRRLLEECEVRAVILVLVLALIGWSIITAWLFGPSGGLCLAIIVLWLLLMFRDFFIGPRLRDHPLAHALTHQIILLPVAVYPALCADGSLIGRPQIYLAGCQLLGAFFSYEICRKINPCAHPVLKNYLTIYGRGWSALFVVTGTALAAWGACLLGTRILLWPIEAALVISLSLLWLRPASFRVIERIAGVSLIIHAWSIATRFLLEKVVS